MKTSVVLLTFLATSLGGLGAAVVLEGCGSASTGGERIVLKTRLEIEPTAKDTFTTGAGWNVSLTRALLATGEFYYFDGAPPLVVQHAKQSWEYAQRWLGLSNAHAHPGHYQAGNALGQMLLPSSVDLLAAEVSLADGSGVDGTYRSARFSFAVPAVGPLAGELDGHAAIAEGIAAKAGEETRTFRAIADLADIEKSAADGHVEGCEFSEAKIESDGVVTATVNPEIWFNLVDFAQIPPGSSDAPSEFDADSQPKIAFAQGIAQLSAYKFSYSKR
jgi:hypothetical protein